MCAAAEGSFLVPGSLAPFTAAELRKFSYKKHITCVILMYMPEAGGQFEPGRSATWLLSGGRHNLALNSLTTSLYAIPWTIMKVSTSNKPSKSRGERMEGEEPFTLCFLKCNIQVRGKCTARILPSRGRLIPLMLREVILQLHNNNALSIHRVV